VGCILTSQVDTQRDGAAISRHECKRGIETARGAITPFYKEPPPMGLTDGAPADGSNVYKAPLIISPWAPTAAMTTPS